MVEGLLGAQEALYLTWYKHTQLSLGGAAQSRGRGWEEGGVTYGILMWSLVAQRGTAGSRRTLPQEVPAWPGGQVRREGQSLEHQIDRGHWRKGMTGSGQRAKIPSPLI